MKRVQTLVIGATCFAVGYALANQNCLVIEEGQWAASDFSACISAERAEMRSTTERETRELVDDLLSRGLLDENGRVHILPIAGKMSELLLKSGAQALLNTQFISARKEKTGYVVTLFGKDGFEEIFAERILNTRTVETGKKFLTATVVMYGEKEAPTGGKLLQGPLGEYTLKVYVGQDVSYPQAREYVERFVKEGMTGVKIYAFANAFGYEYANVIDEKEGDYRAICSLSFGDFLSAFEAGVKAGKEDERTLDI